MGLAFALGWTPCIGPILAAILAVAASKATVARGAGLLAVYSLGLGVPFIIAALAVEPFAAFLARFRAHLAHVERVMGDRKSTRLNSSHLGISYAVSCLKKK